MKNFSVYALLLSFIFSGTISATNSSFDDVLVSNPYWHEIEVLLAEDIIQGYTESEYYNESYYEVKTYKPKQKITRAEFTSLVVKSIFSEEEQKKCDINTYGFLDVAKSEWFAPIACIAKKEGIIQGYQNGLFSPQQNITFPEAIKILFQAYEIRTEKEILFFSEHKNKWFTPYINHYLITIEDTQKQQSRKIFSENKRSSEELQNILSYELTREEMAFLTVSVREHGIYQAFENMDLPDNILIKINKIFYGEQYMHPYAYIELLHLPSSDFITENFSLKKAVRSTMPQYIDDFIVLLGREIILLEGCIYFLDSGVQKCSDSHL